MPKRKQNKTSNFGFRLILLDRITFRGIKTDTGVFLLGSIGQYFKTVLLNFIYYVEND